MGSYSVGDRKVEIVLVKYAKKNRIFYVAKLSGANSYENYYNYNTNNRGT
jgi:hypothetical protein